MGRPKIYPDSDIKLGITLPRALAHRIRVESAKSGITQSQCIATLIEEGDKAKEELARIQAEAGLSWALKFPEGWDGHDLRDRLVELRMRQMDMALALNANQKTFSHWIRIPRRIPKALLPKIQEILRSWIPGSRPFRVGSRSPL